MKVSSRTRRRIIEREEFHNDVIDTFLELKKLIKYYQDEVLQIKSRFSNGEIEEGSEDYFVSKGKLVAYTDHISEITYIFEMIQGYHHDLERTARGNFGDSKRANKEA